MTIRYGALAWKPSIPRLEGVESVVLLHVVNPNSTVSMTQAIARTARDAIQDRAKVAAFNPEQGPRSIEGFVDGAMCLPGLLNLIRAGEEAGASGHLIACFDDTGLEAARSISKGPVIGLCEAGVRAASLISARFSIVTSTTRSIGVIRHLVRNYGAEHQCISVRASGVPVLAIDADAHAGTAIRQEARAAVEEDGAEAIILGCAGMSYLTYAMSDELGVPVIDPVRFGILLLESLVRAGLKTSKTGSYG